jgi:mannitol-1-phosphate 5-dehydrogenase
MHNMSHALTAYLGALRGDTYIWEAVCDPEIRRLAKAALNEISEALSKEYNVPTEDLHAFSDELLTRYENRLLGDTVLRVGRDTKRKLAAADRFVGAIRLCQKHGIHPTHILTGLAAGLLFAPEGDDASMELAADARENGVPHTLKTYCDIEETDALTAEVSALYHHLTPTEKGDAQ